MTVEDMRTQALIIKEKYDRFNAMNDTPKWQSGDYMAGLVGDIGDLSKLTMAMDGKRVIENVDSKVAHELSDCLWSLLVLADQYNIDIVKAFSSTMRELDKRLAKAGVN